MRPSSGRARCFVVGVLAATVACGEGSSVNPVSPTLPATQPNTPLNPDHWSIQGQVIETLTGAPVPNATLDVQGFGPIRAEPDGRFSFESTTLPPFNPYRITVTAPGYVPRDTRVRWQRGDRTDVPIDLIRDGAPFSLTFYRQLVRDGNERPDALRSLTRWTSPPSFYVRTVDETTGRAVEPEVQALVLEWIRRAVTMWTGWSVPSIESGVTARSEAPGWIRVIFTRTSENVCGRAFIGANPGIITLNNDRCNCGSRKIPPSIVVHEVGHALGFWHVSDRASVMYRQDPGGCYPAELSPLEQHHAAIAYRRPPGSRDIDIDPEVPGFLQPVIHTLID